jgi:protein-disulfide isomerase
MDKRFLVIMAIVIAAFVGLFVFSGSGEEGGDTTGNPSNHVKGENSKNVELIAFEDFQCPACAAFEPIVNEVFRQYENEIQYKFRHYPIDTIHPNARAASRAAEAAGQQGKFWEMYDILFTRQQQWSESQSALSIFETYAQELSLDTTKFKEDFASEATNSTINADKQEGNNLGVTGTPTFFLNGQQLDNNDIQTVEGFSKIIEEAVAASENQ